MLLQTCEVEDQMRGEVEEEDGADVAGVHYPMQKVLASITPLEELHTLSIRPST